MNRQQFELAMDLLKPSDWKHFEVLASLFHVTNYPKLRTVASPSGDRGRDAELFSDEGTPHVLLQYSVTEHWEEKIRRTIKQVMGEFPQTRVLIYATNRVIGARADELRSEALRNYGLAVDVHDRDWFADRVFTSASRQAAAEQLVSEIVDPFLASRGVLANKAPGLSSIEQQAALVYLALQWENDTRDKGLTKLSFEALVRSVLRGTDSERRLPRSEIRRKIREVLSTHTPSEVDGLTDLTLSRLTKKVIRHWTKDDEFCLTHEEHQRVQDGLVTLEREHAAFQAEVRDLLERRLMPEDFVGDAREQTLGLIGDRVRRILDCFLLGRGALFAAAVHTGRSRQLGFDDLQDITTRDISDHPDTSGLRGRVVPLVTEIVRELLVDPLPAIQRYIRRLADSYTLLAFLIETPDVQSAIKKIFARGDIWLDTNIILPLFVEVLLEPERRKFTNMLRATRDAGLKLFVTRGVIEEVLGHMHRSAACAMCVVERWEDDVPFLYLSYTLAGKPAGGFTNWLQTFRGPEEPEHDLADYLHDYHDITVAELESDEEKVPPEIQHLIQDSWYAAKERRNAASGKHFDDLVTRKLVRHDLENYLGVMRRQKGEPLSSFGYTCWWLTLDRIAFEIEKRVRQERPDYRFSSPILTADFLCNYLAFGPVRNLVPKQDESALPVALDLELAEYLPIELLEVANQVRTDAKDWPPHVVRRKIRDELNKAKRRLGNVTREGLASVEKELASTTTSLQHGPTGFGAANGSLPSKGDR